MERRGHGPSHTPIHSPQPPQQPAAFADAEVRGKLRHWKQRLARQYHAFERAYRDHALLRPIIEDMIKRSSGKGRRRAFAKLARAFGPGVTLEGLRLDGKFPLAVWSILKPRVAVAVDAAPESGRAQNCVTVNYVLAGVLPRPPGVAAGEGLWTLEVPDHALGRCIQRSALLPDAIIAEAHHNLLRLRADAVIPARIVDPERRFLVKAGPGGFVCRLNAGPDVSFGGEFILTAFADTWLATEMLYDDQVLLCDDGLLGDSWFVPPPLRRIVKDGDELNIQLWQPGLPELLAKPQGSA